MSTRLAAQWLALLVLGLVPGPRATAADRGAVTREVRARLESAEELLREGPAPRARSVLEDAADLARGLGEPNLLQARALDRLADLDRLERRYDDAGAGYERSAEMWRLLLGERQPRLAVTLHNLGAVRLAQGRFDEAGRAFGAALPIWESTLGADSAEAANTRSALENLRRLALR